MEDITKLGSSPTLIDLCWQLQSSTTLLDHTIQSLFHTLSLDPKVYFHPKT